MKKVRETESGVRKEVAEGCTKWDKNRRWCEGVAGIMTDERNS